MSKKGLSDKSKSIIRDLYSGQTVAEIAARWGIAEGKIRIIIGNLRRTGYLPMLAADEAEAEEQRKKEVKREARKREREAIDRHGKNDRSLLGQRQDFRQQCFNHWRDLDKHHPQGWPSLRLPAESYVSKIRPSMANHHSLFGSPSALAAEATGR